MALNNIHLHKLIALLFMDNDTQLKEIRREISREVSQAMGQKRGGGEFYGPFWADVKAHIFGESDLKSLVEIRIARNKKRRNLYPLLQHGFLVWWNDRRRWTNQPFSPGKSLKGSFNFLPCKVFVKVENVISVRDGLDIERAIYPYFKLKPELSEQAARIGLWLLIKALPIVPPSEFRILDIIRGQTFSIDRFPLKGDEQEIFQERYEKLMENYRALKATF